MDAIQIIQLTLDEFKALLQETADKAARQAVEAFTKVKENANEEITITQIAKMYNWSKQTVSSRIKAHNVPTVKLGREIAIKRKFLETIKNPPPKEL